MTGQQALAAAQRYAAAAASGAADDMQAICDPGVEIWHNTDDVTQTLEENLRLGQWLRRRVSDLAFTQIRHAVTEDGFVQRHRMRGLLPGGNKLDVASCLVVTLSDAGLIVRVEEYLDSAALAGLHSVAGSGHGSH